MEKTQTVAKTDAQAAERKDRPRFEDDPTIVRFAFISLYTKKDGSLGSEMQKLEEGGSGLGLDALTQCSVQTLDLTNPKGSYSIVIYRLPNAAA